MSEIIFPFGVEFQKSLLRLLSLDTGFANAAMPYLEPAFFENEALGWAYAFMVRYSEEYNAVPSMMIVMEETRKLDPSVREVYQLTLETVPIASLTGEEWLKDQTIDFIKRNLFVTAFLESKDLYNGGKTDDAYDCMMREMEKIFNTAWSPPDREWLFEEFNQRTSRRMSVDAQGDAIVTGIHDLDHLLGGGLNIGEMGIWVAYPKRGKTTLLTNHGVQAVRRGDHRVLHAVFEGSRSLVANRYDTVFAQREYSKVKRGEMDKETYDRMQYDYQMYAGKLVLRGFTDKWDYTAADILEEVQDLKRIYDWVPSLIIVDYGDLLKGRGKYENETSSQRAAFRDLKSLANRGYALWTASQAQRPKKDLDADAEVLKSRNIADCYDKVRVADFIGSINQTKEERQVHQMRLYGELYRENEADRVISVSADFAKMTITAIRDPGASVLPSASVPLGYVKKPTQRKATL